MKQCRILIADDNEENLYFLRALLQSNGYEILTAIHGADALEKARQTPPDLIIADILMPVMDGFALCREWKSDESLKRIPFIFYTATYTEPQDEALALKIGVDRFIAKPCEPDALLVAVREVLENAAQGAVVSAPASQVEKDILRLYNKRLVRKLEQKMMQVESEVIARRQTETALRESEEKHRRLFETMPQGVVYQDAEGKIIYANPAAEKILGLTLHQMQGRTSSDPRWKVIHEDGSDFPGDMHPAMIALRTGQAVRDVIMGIYNPREDRRRWIKTSAVPLFKEGENKPYQVYTTFDDITEYQRLQAQFLQSQKMEAVGLLAGGVAHDFNNLLTVIKGYAEILLESLDPNDPKRRDIEQIARAGQSAASLTSQLLAFSRKQMRQPRLLNLNSAIDEVGKMLRRLLGEDIDIITTTAPDLDPVHADPGQIQQVLMNLAVNARDAMPKGGSLTIETANANLDEDFARGHPGVKTGRYVMLAISDNGVGMDAATQSRIFEPFFTTKPQGAGTGLGLSTVYGIVRQNGGFIWVYSEPGKGTTFKIYFPRAEGNADAYTAEDAHDLDSGGAETVLIVEDDFSVRALASRILRERGYTVLEASDGAEALDIAGKYDGDIHLVLADVVMPGMSGRDLVRQFEMARPSIKALYVSGYTNTAIVHHGTLDPDVAFLQKPFAVADLLRKVRAVLNS